MKKIWIYIILTLVVFATIIYTFSDNANDYEQQVKKDWKEKEMALLNDNPPVIHQELSIFKPDDQFRVIASVEHIHLPKKIMLPTTDNAKRGYEEYCYLTFNIEDKNFKLKVLKSSDDSELFLAFTDLTNGTETYGGGRFLPVEIKNNAINTILDFNYAYNPYCAYDSRYSCPLPLQENHLNIAVTAGEKIYKKPQ